MSSGAGMGGMGGVFGFGAGPSPGSLTMLRFVMP
jgi:hypothetical protein